ncbi:hypothetical protein DACRYDRAFT_12940 [Dacryopinax primogenitus]|uniref:Auxin efflux carrier n=1 Tax=Dacryopinax primogenitus (strain DJM 731) TaxID=1858805 RepID=M5GB91_DACPD|nr:uncharacterized protein DACRYDRAFT_12940 [Dacryopinax primogenitus]EJU06189.1 hypothetical protein DACRYDRAFT_12940 [Dacryopinax primogenitus]
MTSAAGYYIYAGFVPLLKTFLTILSGYVLTRNGLWTPQGAKGSAVVNVNVALPCLVFSSIVPAFNSTNIAFLGPIFLMAFFYIFAGLLMTLILREIVFVPRQFRWGLITCGAMSNWNNLPTAVLMTIFMHTPFNGTPDTQLGIAFIAVFIVAFQISYFATGFWKTVAWDFADADKVPFDENGYEIPESIKERWERRSRSMKMLWARIRGRKQPTVEHDPEAYGEDTTLTSPEIEDQMEKDIIHDQEKAAASTEAEALAGEPGLGRLHPPHPHPHSQPHATPSTSAPTKRLSPTPSSTSVTLPPSHANAPAPAPSSQPPSRFVPHFVRRWKAQLAERLSPFTTRFARFWAHPASIPFHLVWFMLKNSTSPVTLSILLALPISLIQPLKALFVELEPGSKYYGFALGPDGNPCLQFILNTASFIGGISVPQGLMLLGNSFARMTIPRPITKLPIMAALGMTAIKCVILPVAGVALTQYLTFHTSLIPPDAYALRFVIMFLSGTPGAVNQLVITQLYSPDGKADTLAAFLLVQYIFMFIGSSALAAIILSML